MQDLHEAFDKEGFLSSLRRFATASDVLSLLTDENTEVLAGLCERLLSENRRYNLTAIRDPHRAAFLHFIDSLTVARFLPQGARVLDVGCGGGFPSLPLAAVRPDIEMLAIDSTEKKVRYVAESARLFGLSNLSAISARAEELAHDKRYREQFDVVTARAVAALPVLSELCLPFCKTGGIFLSMKGDAAGDEVRAAGDAPLLLGGTPFRMERILFSNGEEAPVRYAVLSEKQKSTPIDYPRLYQKIVKDPLGS